MSLEDDLRARFLAGMSRAAQTVNIVTTDGPGGRGGMTVSAMTSVSADTEKPTLLICLHRDSSAAPLILANGVFCVNVLRDDQTRISDVFAGRHRRPSEDRPDPEERFRHAEWVAMPSGAPRIVDPLVAFDCRMVSADLVGTHHVFFGEVGGVFIAETGSPLIYAQRSYGAAAPIIAAPSGPPVRGERLSLAVGDAAEPLLPGLLHRFRAQRATTSVTLIEGDQARAQAALMAGEAELALMEDPGPLAGLAVEAAVEMSSYALVPAEDPLAGKARLEAEDFRTRPMVLHTPPRDPERFLVPLRNLGVEPDIACSSGSIATIRRLVGEGLGLALIPSSSSGLESCGTVVRPLSFVTPSVRLVLARRPEAELSPPARLFAELAKAVREEN